MMCNNEVKYVPMEPQAREESLGNIVLNVASKSAEALVLAQRIEGYLFGPRPMDGTTANEPRCLRDAMLQHNEVCASIVDTLRCIVEQLEGS